jgi:hypothetical protein
MYKYITNYTTQSLPYDEIVMGQTTRGAYRKICPLVFSLLGKEICFMYARRCLHIQLYN